jgi:SAM-dependent methyltransferase
LAKYRSLVEINHKLLRDSSILQDSIRAALARSRPASVLEIGLGGGRALLELLWEFRGQPVRFSGINRDPGKPLASSADLLETAREYGIGEPQELARLPLPDLFFYDATQLRFDTGSFDLVYLSSVTRFIPRKAEFLEEICRVLKPGGEALVRVGSSGWDYPHGPAREGALLTPLPARLVLKRGGDLVPLEAYLRLFAEEGFEFEFINRPACVLRIRKRAPGALALRLRFDPGLSVRMIDLPYQLKDESGRFARSGVRSVYEVGDAEYRTLRERGWLEPPARPAEPGLGPEPAAGRPGASPRSRTRPLSAYRVGQRVKVRGQQTGPRAIHAIKVRLNQDAEDREHLEGRLEAVDAPAKVVWVLGEPVAVDRIPGAKSVEGEVVPIGALQPGALLKVKGVREGGRLVAEKIKLRPPAEVVIDEVQGPITALHPADDRFEVGGFQIRIDSDTKLDKVC